MSGFGFIEPMTSSNTLKKLLSISAALLLAVGSSLTSAAPASAAAATSAPAIVGTPLASGTVSVTPAVWASGTGTGKWYICDRYTVTPDTAATSVPNGCEPLYTANGNTAPITATTLTVPSIAYCANMCTPYGNNSVGSKLRWIEVNGSDTSASAALVIRDGRSLSLQNPASGATSVALGVSMGCSFASSTLSSFADWTLLVGGVAKTITSVGTANGNITLNFSGAVTSGQSISVNYVQSSDPEISCGSNAFVKSLTTVLTGTVSGGGGGGSSYTMITAPSYSITNGVATADVGTWSGGTPTLWWILCDNPRPTPVTTSPTADCMPMALTQNGSEERGTTVTLSTTVWKGFSGSFTQVALASQYFALYVSNSGSRYITASSAGPAPSVAAAAPLRPVDALRALKPVPAAVQPLVPAFIALNKPMASLGGKVALSAGDFTGLVSAKIAGKSLDFILGNTGKITMTVPQGEAGKTADLVLTFNTGSIILQDAIKYVAPLDVAKVGERPIAIAAGAKKITAEVADQIRHAALANVKNDTIQCIAYSANNSAAAKAAAQLTAVQACGVAVKANSDLKVADVVVIVDKLKARTQGVGIKVYKADN